MFINTLFTGKVRQEFESLASTNSHAYDLLAKTNPSEGTVIVARDQSAGRGQYGSNWHSAPGLNLSMSLIWYPHFLALPDQFALSIAVSLGCRDALQSLVAQEIRIKWPNDLYTDDRKIGGILIQNQIQSQSLRNSIIGIGLNVNEIHFPDWLPNPVSLAQISDRHWDLGYILDAVCYYLEKRYLELRAGRMAQQKAEYLRHLYGLGEPFIFQTPDGEAFRGVAQGINSEGHLQVNTAQGLRSFAIREIKWMRRQ